MYKQPSPFSKYFFFNLLLLTSDVFDFTTAVLRIPFNRTYGETCDYCKVVKGTVAIYRNRKVITVWHLKHLGTRPLCTSDCRLTVRYYISIDNYNEDVGTY